MTDSHAERRAALLLTGLVLPLTVLTVLAAVRFDLLFDADTRVVVAWRTEAAEAGLLQFFRVVGAVSHPWVVRAMLLVIALVYALRRQSVLALWMTTVVLVNGPLWGLTKQLVDRPRPVLTDQVDGFSFPSGHASEIAAGMGVLVVLTLRGVRRQGLRWTLVALEVGIAVLVGLDRIVLAAHHPSDVLAGWLLGTLVVTATGLGFGVIRLAPRTPMTRALSSVPENHRTLAVILNPIKVADADAFKASVSAAARATGWDEPLWFETTVDDAGADMARAAVAAGADVVVVAGGDGTVRVVCAEMAGSGIPVGVIPAGTGNLLARNLGIPLVRDQAVETVLLGQDRAIDVVRVEGDRLAPTRFLVMAGLGLDAAIMDGAPDALKKRIGWPAYVVAGARHLRYPAVRVDIRVDGGEPVRRRARTVVIGNVGSLQAGIPLLPDALIDDGLIDVVVIAPRRAFGWFSLAWRVMTKHPRTDERLDRYTGRSVELTVPSPTPRQLDGDTVGPGTTLRAEIEPGLLLVRVPR